MEPLRDAETRWIDPDEAARILGIDPRQGRNLAGHGVLEGRKVSGVWILDEGSVLDYARNRSGQGRPLSARVTWLLLAALDRAGSGGDPIPDLAPDRRVRWRLRSHLARAPDPSEWSAWFRHRGERHRLWLHPGVLARFAGDPRVVHPDLSHRLGINAADLVPFYIAKSDLPEVVADHHGRLGEGNNTVMSVSASVSDGLDWRCVAPTAALVDLAAVRDPRVASAARDELANRLLALGPV